MHLHWGSTWKTHDTGRRMSFLIKTSLIISLTILKWPLTSHSWCLTHGSQKTECSVQSACPTRWPFYHCPEKQTYGFTVLHPISVFYHIPQSNDLQTLLLPLTPETNVFPVSDGARSSDRTSAVWPWKLCSSCPLSTSHNAHEPSPLEVRSCKENTAHTISATYTHHMVHN